MLTQADDAEYAIAALTHAASDYPDDEHVQRVFRGVSFVAQSLHIISSVLTQMPVEIQVEIAEALAAASKTKERSMH